MAGFVTERLREMILDPLKAKCFDEDRTPQTIIGKNYLWDVNNVQLKVDDRHQTRPPLIQKVDDFNLPQGMCAEEMVAYGPFYHDYLDQQCCGNVWSKVKDEAWKHVLRNSSHDDQENETKTSSITRWHYLEAVRRVEDEARALYCCTNDDSVARLSSDEFVWMMIHDGCFFLQVALLVLGGSKQLINYPQDAPLFGKPVFEVDLSPWPEPFVGFSPERRTQVMTRTALWSMFLVGNQIPLLVLKELIKQSFFQKVINQGIWEEPKDLERLVLYKLLLVPVMLDSRGGGGGGEAISIPTSSLREYSLFQRHKCLGGGGGVTAFIKRILQPFSAWFWQKKTPQLINANDILHGLWLLMIGLTHSKEDEEDVIEDFFVNEEEEEEEDVNDDHDHSRYGVIPPTMVPSATEMKKLGVVFKYKMGTRIKGMQFRKDMFGASLILPRLVLVDTNYNDSILIMMLRSLIRYEIIHFGKNQRKVSEYFRLMCGLVRSPEDVKILTAKGIIVAAPHKENEVCRFFSGLDIKNNGPEIRRHDSDLIRSITDELNNYNKPSQSKKMGDVLSLVVFLTLIQTAYSVLSYHLHK